MSASGCVCLPLWDRLWGRQIGPFYRTFAAHGRCWPDFANTGRAPMVPRALTRARAGSKLTANFSISPFSRPPQQSSSVVPRFFRRRTRTSRRTRIGVDRQRLRRTEFLSTPHVPVAKPAPVDGCRWNLRFARSWPATLWKTIRVTASSRPAARPRGALCPEKGGQGRNGKASGTRA
jgi:hypothetical protein